jgi:hypothetical protein
MSLSPSDPNRHNEAREILRQAWINLFGSGPDDSQLAYAQAVALLETGYGRIGQFANMASQGIFNWGALQKQNPSGGSCPPGTFPGGDTFQGRPVNVCFFGYSTDVEAAQSFLKTLVKSFPARSAAVLAAMHGSPLDVALAMRVSPAYYTDPATKYASAITNALHTMGVSPSSSSSVAPVASAAAGTSAFIFALAGTAFTYWLVTKLPAVGLFKKTTKRTYGYRRMAKTGRY